MGDIDTITPGYAEVSATDHGAWVIVASWIFILNTILVTIIRSIWRFRVTRKVPIDDWVMMAATMAALAETIAITLSCRDGLGRHLDTLSASEIERYDKSFYATQILLVTAVGLSKISVTHTILALRPYDMIRRICYGLQGFNSLWTLAGIFSFAFQCSLPQPWNSTMGKCVDQYSLQLSIWTISFLSDITIVALPAILMYRVQITTIQKWSVSLLFGSRIIVIILTILALISIRPFYKTSPPDPTWLAVDPMVFFQVMLNLSLITASVPTIKRFLMEFRSGVSGAELTLEFEESTSGKRGLPNTGLSGSDRKKGDFKNQLRSAVSLSRSDSRMAVQTRVERSESIHGLTDNIILQTIDFQVHHEDNLARQPAMESPVADHESGPKSWKSSEPESDNITYGIAR